MRRGTLVLLGASVLVLAVVCIAHYGQDLGRFWSLLLEWLSDRGGAAPFIFIALYVLSCVFLIPAGPLTPAAGAIFGVPLGLCCVSIGALTGACAAFLISRHLLRDWVVRRQGSSDSFERLDTAVHREGWRIVALLRLCPLIPFRLSNYILGATAIDFREFAIATWVGTLPAALFWVTLGSTARRVADLPDALASPAALSFYAAGTAVLGVLVWYLARIARRALTSSLGEAA